ncbi:protein DETOXIFICATION 19 [Citrus sinensis]|uniref:Protein DETOXIFICATION 19 n=1 Tax=Citrus sinensis TaxID=2711 RepID=A0ACB8NXH3_CITSI|nr:protein DETOXIFICATION 19 [Citrus sinensis]
MLGNRSSDNHTKPLLGTGDNINNYNLGEEERRWWRKWKEVLDVEEAKNQVLFSLPMIVANVSYYAIPLVSVMFAGHLGDLELAGATLANSWACVTGFDFTNFLRFLQTQSIVMPLVFCSALPLAIHFGIAYSLVHWTSLGFSGAPLACSISLWISTLLLAIYIHCSKKTNRTWEGLSFESFSVFLTNLKVALSSAAMVCRGDAKLRTVYFIDRNVHKVSNELGAGMIDRAKNAMAVTLKLVVLLALIIDLALTFGHNIWAGFFADSQEIRNFAGVARGCGWQHLAVWVNLATFYFIGMPLALLFGFKLNLHAKGLWIGLICGLAAQASSLFLIVLRRKFTNVDIAVSREKEVPLSI